MRNSLEGKNIRRAFVIVTISDILVLTLTCDFPEVGLWLSTGGSANIFVSRVLQLAARLFKAVKLPNTRFF